MDKLQVPYADDRKNPDCENNNEPSPTLRPATTEGADDYVVPEITKVFKSLFLLILKFQKFHRIYIGVENQI